MKFKTKLLLLNYAHLLAWIGVLGALYLFGQGYFPKAVAIAAVGLYYAAFIPLLILIFVPLVLLISKISNRLAFNFNLVFHILFAALPFLLGYIDYFILLLPTAITITLHLLAMQALKKMPFY